MEGWVKAKAMTKTLKIERKGEYCIDPLLRAVPENVGPLFSAVIRSRGPSSFLACGLVSYKWRRYIYGVPSPIHHHHHHVVQSHTAVAEVT